MIGVFEAWQKGAVIEFRSQSGGWKVATHPSWTKNIKYRVQKRVFTDDKFYWAKYEELSAPEVILHHRGSFSHLGSGKQFSEEDFYFIGEEIKCEL